MSKAFSISSLVKLKLSTLSKISPDESYVSVVIPNVNSQIYDLSLFNISSLTLVAFPIHIGNTPDASGSRVPVCPTFFVFKIFFYKKSVEYLLFKKIYDWVE